MKSWKEIYEERLNDVYRQHIRTKYGPFINLIHEVATIGEHGSFVELGCGAGNITRELHAMDSDAHYTMVDIDMDMLFLVKKNTEHMSPVLMLMDISCAEIFLSHRAVIHSHGVLEHLSDQQIKHIINTARKHGPQIHYVPSSKYEVPSRGDERLLPPTY